VKDKLSKRDQEEFSQFLKDLGKHIQKIREASGKTQVQMFDEPYPIDGKNFQKYELGTRNFTMQSLYVLARKLNVSLQQLLEFDAAANTPAKRG